MKDNINVEESITARQSLGRQYVEGIKYVGRLDAVITRVDGSQEYIGPSYNARVNAGAAYEANAVFQNAVTTAPFQYIALSSTTVSPAIGDTALSGEITTNGFARVLVTPTYTAPSTVGGIFSIVFSHTFTATGSQTVNSLGLLNASSGGTLFSEIALATTATLVSADTLLITYTINS